MNADLIGKIVKGPFVNEPMEILKLEKLDGVVRIAGYAIFSKEYVDRYITEEDFHKIEVLAPSRDFSADSEKTFLYLEAARMKYASIFDPLLAMSVSKIDPYPFQIEAVYGYILKQPQIRFLLADDPGAGKTIMAGLVIKELKLRRLASRILIVVPGHLKFQWKREMKDRFGEEFEIIDGNTFKNIYGENPWEKYNQVITSLDFAKQQNILPSLRAVTWDLVIVDEAHKMSANVYGSDIKRTQRYRLGQVLSEQSIHMIFLTATPHSGDSEKFRLFLDLLKPGFFATVDMINESIKSKDNPLFLRRLKEDLKDFEGKPIFTRRIPRTVKFQLSDLEKDLYNELSRYVSEQYNKALQTDKNRNVAFALAIFQRRMASSVYALLNSLERRKSKLEKILRGEELPKQEIKRMELSEDYAEYEDSEELERWKMEEKMETVVITPDRKELEREIEVLDRLIRMANKVLEKEEEVKLKELKKAIEEGFKRIEEMDGRRKILIFTEFKDTLEYLVKKIQSWGYKVNFIHGGMKMEERVMAEKIFKNETEIMVATEAAGEGINLQFCHIMINYDIPWNPNRLEQRMGRIHRIGQTKDVYIFNLVSEDTREGVVLARILDKLDEIRKRLGSDKVFDVIGEIFEGKNFYKLIVEAAVNAKDREELLKEIEAEPDEEYLNRVKSALEESLATRFINYAAIKEMAGKAEESRLAPEYVEEFFKKAFIKAGGKIRELRDGFVAIDSIPHEILQIARSESFKNRYGQILKRYSKVTFDKNIASNHPEAEFVSFGHPLFEAVIEWVQRNFEEEVRMGSVFKDLSGKLNGYVWFYMIEVTDGKGETVGRKIVALYDDGSIVKEVNPSILWDLLPYDRKIEEELTEEESRIKSEAVKLALNYKEELKVDREKQAQIKKKYGIRSLEYLINKLDTELVELYERLDRGEKTELPIRNKEEQKRLYEVSKKELEKEIEREMRLDVSAVELITVIRVISEKDSLSESQEIEDIGMKIAMEYEIRNGRKAVDVSKENLGFDIKSEGRDEVRYIEVKARAGEGSVELTPNEWMMAKRFKDKYWLYIISNAATDPTLNIIQNPADRLKTVKKVEVRYVIPAEEWKAKGRLAS